jgi:hypothetical protein
MFAVKQAECVITGVSYTDGENRQLDYVQVRMLNDDGSLGNSIFWSRDKLLHAIKTFNIGFVTAMFMPEEPDNFFLGDNVVVVLLDGDEYIRTDGSDIPEDDLGDVLPS